MFDLNLLRVITALDRTKHVSRAAEFLNMSQSGFSSALARLRRHTGDPLFIRTGSGMVPTARARQLTDAARLVLATVDEAFLRQPEFNPAEMQTRFCLGMSDMAEPFLIPRLLKHMQKAAPRATVQTLALSPGALTQALGSGEIDLTLGYFPELTGELFMAKRLYSTTFACIARHRHPVARKSMTTAAFEELGHISISSPSRAGALLEHLLQRRGIERRIVLQTSHHMGLPAIVEATDLIATVPLALAVWSARQGRVELLPLPFVPDRFDVKLYWHRRFDRDSRHRWLRQQIESLFAETSGGSSAPQLNAIEHNLYGSR